MAVEARHINPFPSQLINRNLMMNNNNQEAVFMMRPASSFNVSQSSSQQLIHQYFTSNNTDDHINTFATPTLPEQKLFSSHRQQPNSNPIVYESSLHAKTESGLTFNNIIPNSRKRSRDEATNTNQIYTDFQKTLTSVPQPLCPPSLLGDDSLQAQILQQHQYEVEALISQHTKKIRLELAEKQRQHARSLLASLSQAMAKKLKEKEEQIARMGKENIALQERVKALYVENQLWRDLAQTNEATANSLRTNLEQLLSHVSNEEQTHVADDVESCCGSSGDRDDVDDNHRNRWCKICSERESCVLLLPCRHLCLCGVCGHTVKACPVCHCSMNATVHVNLSSS